MGYELFSLIGATLSLLLVALYRFLVQPYQYFERRGLLGPKAVAVFGSWWGRWNKHQGEEDLRNVKQFGPIYGEYAGRTPVLVAADPVVARAVLVGNAANFRSRRANCVRDKFLHQGLLAVESQGGPNEPQLTQELIRKLLPRILYGINYLTTTMQEIAELTDEKMNTPRVVPDYLIKVLMDAALGQDDNDRIDITEFTCFFNKAFVNDNPDSPLATIPLIYPSITPMDKFVLRPDAAKFFTSLIRYKLHQKANAAKDKDRHPDLMDLLLEVHQAAKKLSSEEEAKTEESILEANEFVFVQTLAVLLNTSQTARAMITLGLTILGTKPELQDRLHTELHKLEVADELELAQNSEYLDMFLSEVLRLYPLEYRLERECCETLELEKVKIEKGMIVSIPVYALHRQAQFYDEPEDFNPDRFSRDKKEKREPFAYLPYGQTGNSATNFSIQWSVLLAKLAIASVVKKCKFLPAENIQLPPTFKSGVTGIPALPPVDIRVENRK